VGSQDRGGTGSWNCMCAASVWEVENTLNTDGGDRGRTIKVDLRPLN
jgi:hypothetical protein